MVAIAAAGSDTPRLDAELLLGARARRRPRRPASWRPSARSRGPRCARFQDLVRRRSVGREPVAYLLGTARLPAPRARRRRARAGPAAGDRAARRGGARPAARRARASTSGTGSGAVALALKDERPDLDVRGTDVSDGGAGRRARQRGAPGPRRRRCRAPTCSRAPGRSTRCSPTRPTWPRRDRATLPPEVARHEPALALFAGPDGLDVVRRLVAQAGASAATLLALEVGAGPGAGRRRARAGGRLRARCEALRDLAGIERVVVGRRVSGAAHRREAARRRRRSVRAAASRSAAWRCSRPTPSTGWPASPTAARPSQRLYFAQAPPRRTSRPR